MINQELQGESFLIIGYGREGRSVHQFLRTRFPNARIGVADRQKVTLDEAKDEGSVTFSGDSYLAEASSFDTIIRSPGVSLREVTPHLKPHNHLTSATNIFFAETPGKIIGVTGTKGKSTTSSLTASILKQALPDVRLVGNIGIPMLDNLIGADDQTVFVVELSSYQLEDLRRSPTVAILLNIVPEHLDYHGDFAQYCAAKCNIARHQRGEDVLICNTSSFPRMGELAKNLPGTLVSFCENNTPQSLVSVVDDQITLTVNGTKTPIIKVDELPIMGPGNLQNALAAITCAAVLEIPVAKIRAGVLSFTPLEHRLEPVATRHGITFYNDSLSTIPEALAHALTALGSRVETVIAGGFDRGVDMTSVGPAIAGSNVKTLILFPTTGEKIWNAVTAYAPTKAYRRIDAQTMDEAVQAAYNYTAAGKICVMSPASSSFSVFRDYRERGERFKDAVRRLSPLPDGRS